MQLFFHYNLDFSFLHNRQFCLLTNPYKWKYASSLKIIFFTKSSGRGLVKILLANALRLISSTSLNSWINCIVYVSVYASVDHSWEFVAKNIPQCLTVENDDGWIYSDLQWYNHSQQRCFYLTFEIFGSGAFNVCNWSVFSILLISHVIIVVVGTSRCPSIVRSFLTVTATQSPCL